jgi:hypothetical protein
MPPIPPSLLVKCPEPELAQSGMVAELLAVHTRNTGKAGRCRQRHGALTDLIDQLRNREGESDGND